jgi:hypothetical protein
MRRSASTNRRSTLIGVAREVVLDPHVFQYPRIAENFGEFGADVGPMQPGCHEDRYLFTRDARGEHRLHHRAQEEMIRHRPRDVANEDAGARSSLHEFRERWRADRRGQGARDRIGSELGARRLPNHRDVRAVGNVHRQCAATEC